VVCARCIPAAGLGLTPWPPALAPLAGTSNLLCILQSLSWPCREIRKYQRDGKHATRNLIARAPFWRLSRELLGAYRHDFRWSMQVGAGGAAGGL
jgi:hypothetical protein